MLSQKNFRHYLEEGLPPAEHFYAATYELLVELGKKVGDRELVAAAHKRAREAMDLQV